MSHNCWGSCSCRNLNLWTDILFFCRLQPASIWLLSLSPSLSLSLSIYNIFFSSPLQISCLSLHLHLSLFFSFHSPLSLFFLLLWFFFLLFFFLPISKLQDNWDALPFNNIKLGPLTIPAAVISWVNWMNKRYFGKILFLHDKWAHHCKITKNLHILN